MKKWMAVSGAMAMAAMAAQVSADQGERWPRWYVGLSGGVGFLGDTDIKGGERGKIGYNTGAMGTVSLGYLPPATMQPFSNMRFEAELGYRDNGLNKATVNGTPTTTSGALQSASYMGNAYYDFSNATAWTPYIGAGAGGARVHLSKSSGIGNSGENSNVFAYQFMAGLSYAPSTMPNTVWGVGYRYFVENGPSFASSAGSLKLDSPKSSDVELNARFRF